MTTLIHFVVVSDPDDAVAIQQLSGAEPNKSHGAVVPVKAVTGKQQFACCLTPDRAGSKANLCMRKHAGKQFEGANHGGTGDPQFVNCPMCLETFEYKEAMAEHERYTSEHKGLFAHLFNKKRASSQGGEARAVAGTEGSEQLPEASPAQ